MSRRVQGLRPVIVEVKPDCASDTSSRSPSGSPKVRFASTSTGPVAGVSRPLSSVEEWSLYHFETHARSCESCFNPMDVYRQGRHLCHKGHGLAQDVAYHVQYRNGEFYSMDKTESDFVRVEIPHDYTMLKSLLKAIDRRTRSSRQHTPIVSYDQPYPITSRPRRTSYHDVDDRPTVVVEPHKSSSRRKHKSHYATQVVDDYEDIPVIRIADPKYTEHKYKERRGTLYEKDKQRRKETYFVEVREPSRRERPRSTYWS